VHRVGKKRAEAAPPRTLLASDDPDSKPSRDILGLYLRPPQYAAVFCVE